MRKLVYFVLIGMTCIFSTGFISIGSEKPKEGIQALVAAIDNNDGVAFMERLPREYWVRLVSEYMGDHESPTYAWLKNLFNTSKSIERARNKDVSRAVQSYYIMDALIETIEGMVNSGDFANYCRRYKSPTLPFDPNVLNKLAYGEDAVGPKKNIVVAVATMPDGQEGVLGMVFIEKKWRIVSLAGNKKAAIDKAESARKVVEEKFALIAKRKESDVRFIEQEKKYIDEVQKLITEKKWDELAELNIKSVGSFKHDYKGISFVAPKKIDNLWNLVFEGMVKLIRNPPQKDVQRGERKKSMAQSLKGHTDYIKNFSKRNTTEILWEQNNFRLIREAVLLSSAYSHISAEDFRKRWLNDDISSLKVYYIYRIQRKDDGIWHSLAISSEGYEPYNSFPKSNIVYPFYVQVNKLPLSIEKYNLELAKRFEGLYEKAKIQVANEQKWTKEVQDIINILSKAYTNNDPETIEKYTNLKNLFRDQTSFNDSVIAIAKYEDNDEDIKLFLERIRLGKLKKNPYHGLKVKYASELKAYTSNDNKMFYLFVRDTIDAPWKLNSFGTLDFLNNRPKDWDKKIAAAVIVKKKEIALKKSIDHVFLALKKGHTDNDPKVFEQYINLASFLRDNGKWDITLVNIVDNIKDNKDIKTYLEQVRSGKWQKETPFSQGFANYSIVEAKSLRSIVKVNNLYVLLQRESEKDSWKILYHAPDVKGLERSKDWNETIAELVPSEIKAREEAEALRKKALANMQTSMKNIGTGLAKAIKNGDLDALFHYVGKNSYLGIVGSSLSDIEPLKNAIENNLAPDLYFRELLSKSFAKKDTEKFGALFNVEAWENATYDFVGSSEKVVIATLLFAGKKQYALFAAEGDTYKLIVTPSRYSLDMLEKFGDSYAGEWIESIAKLETNSKFKELRNLAQMLKDKKGQDFMKSVDFASIKFWQNVMDREQNIDMEVMAKLFPSAALKSESQVMANAISKDGKLIYGPFTITFDTLSWSPVHVLDNDDMAVRVENTFLFFAKDGGKYRLKAITNTPNRKDMHLVMDVYKARHEELESRKKSILRTVAAQTASNAVLDLLQVETGEYEVFKTQKGTTQLRVKVTVKNTSDKPMLPSQFMLYFVDNLGQNWSPWLTNTKSKEIKPLQKQTFEWEFFPNSKEMYVLQQAQKGTMYFMVRTSEAKLDETVYTRFGKMIDLNQLSDGKWQLGNFAPIVPKPQWRSASKEAQKAFWDGMKKNARPLSEHKGEVLGRDILLVVSQASPVGRALAEAKKKAEEKVAPVQNTVPSNHEQPIAPAPKKPGKGIVVPITTDTMSLTAFSPDTKIDSNIRVLVHGKSPLVGIRVESMGSAKGSWKTKDVKVQSLGVLAVSHAGKVLNANNTSFSLDVTTPVLLDLIMQDNGSIANTMANMRVVFYHKDGSRTYSRIQR